VRRSTTERGYGNDHQKARRAALAAMTDGQPCSRCRRPMYRSQPLHLDHTEDRRGYLGLAHARCNMIAGASKGGRRRARRTASPARVWTSREW
jgi:hypothetical protein